MKRIVTLIMLTISVLTGFAQHYESFRIEELANSVEIFYCIDDDLIGIIIYGEENCENNIYIAGSEYIENADSIVVNQVAGFRISYYGCDIAFDNHYLCGIDPIILTIDPIPNSVTFKKQNEVTAIHPSHMFINPGIDFLWSTGETTFGITVTEPGTYWITITSACGSITDSVEVRDNVELYRATVDLRTNKNKVTWQVTPEQAEYITDVKVYRDDVLVGTAPYTNGYFLDAIGSDAAARNYYIVGVSVEGDDCPIPSYEKSTIHTTYYEDVDGNLNMTWNAPYVEEGAQGTLTGYQICKYNPVTEEVTVVDQVNKLTTDYTCSASVFIGGQATIAAVFDSKDSPLTGGDPDKSGEEVESRCFSNRNTMLAVDENEEQNFKIYPNPANGTFTVEGATTLTIYNTLGQIIATSHNKNEKHSITVDSGIYFIKSDEGAVQKIIVQ